MQIYKHISQSRPCCIRDALTAEGFVANLNFNLWK